MKRDGEYSHVDLYVEILEVERVYPGINTNHGDVLEERVLVSGGRNPGDV